MIDRRGDSPPSTAHPVALHGRLALVRELRIMAAAQRAGNFPLHEANRLATLRLRYDRDQKQFL